MSIDLYYNKFSGPSRAALMTVRQLNIDINLKQLDLSAGEHMTPEYLAINPNHKVPTLVDGEFVLWESRAIMQYLCNRYAPDSTLYPKDPKKRALVDRSLNFDFSFLAQLSEVMAAKIILGIEPPADKVTAVNGSFKLLDQLIGDNRYITGDNLTIADLSLVTITPYLEQGGIDLNLYPNVQRWADTLRDELPYYEEINIISQAEWDTQVEKYRAIMGAKPE